MAARFSKGDRVRWRTSGGTASGTIERVVTSRVKVGGRTVAGSADDPRYLAKNAETGKTTVLKGSSLRSAAPPRDKATPTAKLRQAKPPSEAHSLRRWAAPLALLAAVIVVGAIVLLSTGDDDDDGGDAPAVTTEATATEATETEPATTATEAGPASAAIQDALAAQPLAIRGIPPIAVQRLGDEQEALASGFTRRYDRALSALDALGQASAGGDGGEELAGLAGYAGQQVEADQAITTAFVENSFSDGDSTATLAEKTARTEAAVKSAVRKADGIEPPAEATDLHDAFDSSWKATLVYLGAVSDAVDSGNQAALDQALRDGRTRAGRASRQLAAAATALQEQTESEAGG
jgi:hypothetical protein